MMQKVVVIGSGNVAEALARAAEGRFELVQIVARNERRGREVATLGKAEWTAGDGGCAAADLYILAVSDAAIADVSASLPELPPEAVVAHTAGCVTIEAIADRFAHRAVIYPFQTFTEGRAIEISEVPFFIESSDAEAEAEAMRFACGISKKVFRTEASARRIVHLAGVLACNFVNRLYAEASKAVRGAGFPFDILAPIILETAAKAAASADPTAGQTGPAVRGDAQTLNDHLEMLCGEPAMQEIYSLLSRRIWETSKKI